MARRGFDEKILLSPPCEQSPGKGFLRYEAALAFDGGLSLHPRWTAYLTEGKNDREAAMRNLTVLKRSCSTSRLKVAAIAALLACPGSLAIASEDATQTSSSSDAPKAHSPASTGGNDLPAERVAGIGGFFFRSKDPMALAKWYEVHLGITLTPTEYGNPGWQQTAGSTVFQPFPATTKYFGAPDKQWMIDFRVSNMDAMVRQLKASNIDVKVDPTVYPNGRFARLYDPEGNAIELWEPANVRK